jgi:2-oxo-4-hydroxy-4-carboxy-5-ureidoimidazoline decarboxylase
MELDTFNQAPADEVGGLLAACCDVPSWVDAVRAGRPYPDVDAAVALADEAARRFSRADVDRALAAHPRIGERAAGDGTAAGWSRQEQGGLDNTDTGDATRDALATGNRAYEDRFGRVFLICASGLGAEQILTALQTRLGNDEDTEAAVVADELRKIAVLRLRKALDAEASG